MDYIIIDKSHIVPVEVKSGPAGRLRSMHFFLKEHSDSPYGLILNSSVISELADQKLKFMPLYTKLA